MKGLIALGIVCLFGVGCSSTTYVKPGATQADLETDRVACRNQILMSSTGAGMARAEMARPGVRGFATQSTGQRMRVETEECLRSKGWTLQPKSE